MSSRVVGFSVVLSEGRGMENMGLVVVKEVDVVVFDVIEL